LKRKIPVQNTDFISAGHNIQTPFSVILSTESSNQEVKCSRVLRNLPGKRLVCAAETGGQKVVAKFFTDPKKGKMHCRREEQGLSAFAKAGINTSELIFRAAIDPEGGRPVLVFRMFEDATDFTVAWERAQTDSRRMYLLKMLASTTALIHEAGLIHNDAHPGNFMVSGDLLYAIDGASVKVPNRGRALSPSRSVKNLAAVFSQFEPCFDHLFAEAFTAYTEKRKYPKSLSHANLLKKQIRIQRKKREKKYLKKIYRQSSAQVCSRGWDHFVVCKRNGHTRAMARLLEDPDRFISEGKLLKKGNSSTVAVLKVDGRSLVVKRYNIKSFGHALSRCFRPSRAWRSWKNAHRLLMLGIATPQPVGLLEKRFGPLRSKAYFITEYSPGLDAYGWFHSSGGKKPDVYCVIRQFGHILQIFYEHLIVHGDFKATNFILTENNRIVVIDLDAMRCHTRMGWYFHRQFARDCQRLMQNWSDIPEVSDLFYQEIEARGLLIPKNL